MKKAFNLRLPVLGASAMVLGIAFAAILACFKSDGIFILIPAAIILAACALFAVITRSASKALIFIFTAVCFLIGAVYAYAKYFSFCQTEIPVGELAQISGRVEEVGTTSSGSKYLILTNVKAYGTAVSGRLYAYLNGNAGDYCQRGYDVTFYATIEKQNFIEYGEISYRATKGVKYWSNVYGGLQSKYRFSLFGEIFAAIERALNSALDRETAAVCLAMLTGEDGGISKGTLASFRYGGVAHVFAVSGLHIGVIYFALGKIFKKLKLKRIPCAVIKIAFVAAYSGVCGFSPSSVRAVVLCAAMAASDCFYKKSDGFNALAIAAILLLLINPFYLFQVGFTMSFGAMLGITLLSGNLKKLFAFLPEKFARALAVGWSAQVGTLPVQITKFGYVSAAGLLLNIVFVQVISEVYVLMCFGTV
ncbi:MAG: ComEC/Rec2 family competence protein, partial [Clostridia bacterium]|nr:ComEC/Rec2 family competence protein [Clostridia bacterium]